MDGKYYIGKSDGGSQVIAYVVVPDGDGLKKLVSEITKRYNQNLLKEI